MQKLTSCKLKEIIKEELQELDYTNMDLSRTASKEPAQHRIRVKPDRAEEAAKLLQQNGIDFHDYYKASGGFVVFTFVKRWNRDDAFKVLKKQGLTIQGQFSENIGWDNLPDGWDEDSVESFARSLTDKTKDDSEGFFRACMDEVEDKFDDPEAFCASLKDEYLDTTDWRGESASKPRNMKLTETQLRKIIRKELEESVIGARHQGVSTGREAMKPKNVFHQLRKELEENYREPAPNVFEVEGMYLKPGKTMIRVYTDIPNFSEYHDGFIDMDNYPYGKVGVFDGRATADSEPVEFQYASQFLDEAIRILKKKLNPMKEQKLRRKIRETVSKLFERDESKALERLKSEYEMGGMVTKEIGGRLWNDVERRLLNHTDADQRYLNNFQAFFISDVDALNRNEFDNVEVWGSFEDPKGSMTPTERVKFHRIHP